MFHTKTHAHIHTNPVSCEKIHMFRRWTLSRAVLDTDGIDPWLSLITTNGQGVYASYIDDTATEIGDNVSNFLSPPPLELGIHRVSAVRQENSALGDFIIGAWRSFLNRNVCIRDVYVVDACPKTRNLYFLRNFVMATLNALRPVVTRLPPHCRQETSQALSSSWSGAPAQYRRWYVYDCCRWQLGPRVRRPRLG